jgi:hypothetical protein
MSTAAAGSLGVVLQPTILSAVRWHVVLALQVERACLVCLNKSDPLMTRSSCTTLCIRAGTASGLFGGANTNKKPKNKHNNSKQQQQSSRASDNKNQTVSTALYSQFAGALVKARRGVCGRFAPSSVSVISLVHSTQ